MSSKKVGCIFTNKSGDSVKVIKYLDADNCTIQFEDGTTVEKVSFRRLKYGKFVRPKKREGEEFITNQGYKIKIIEYKSSKNCTAIINDDYVCKNLIYSNIKKGQVDYPYHPSVRGVGYIGVGTVNKKSVSKWRNIFNRHYNSVYKDTHTTYKKIKVSEDWLNYQNFAKWFEENWKPYMDSSWHLDKDILQKGNEIYSAETCAFVPQEINKLFTKTNAKRGQYPIGVVKSGTRFTSKITKGDNVRVHLGLFNTPEEAFEAYKTAKENYIKEVADKWKGLISDRVYQAMYNYEVEITD